MNKTQITYLFREGRRDLCWVKGTEGGERREDTEGQMRETSWVSRTTVRDEMGFRTEGGESLQATTKQRDRGEKQDGLQG